MPMTNLPKIGFIGLGSMGGPMARNLISAGYTVKVHDLDAAKVAACVELGAKAAQSIAELVQSNDVIMTSVPSFEIAVALSNEQLLPHAQSGQIFIELSTITPQQARDLAAAFAERGAIRIDAPVSGGAWGAEKANLRMFIGGDQTAVQKCWSIFEVLGDPDHIVYCGAEGDGQMVKIVNQLAMGLSNAIYLETIGFTTRAGIDPDILVKAIGGNEPWRMQFERIAQRIKADEALHTDVKFVQLKQFYEEAESQGYTMPMTRALFEFCDKGERISQEEIYPAPSFWHELMQDSDHK